MHVAFNTCINSTKGVNNSNTTYEFGDTIHIPAANGGNNCETNEICNAFKMNSMDLLLGALVEEDGVTSNVFNCKKGNIICVGKKERKSKEEEGNRNKYVGVSV